MEKIHIFCAGTTAAAGYAAGYLSQIGIPVSKAPAGDATHLLLDVPSFRSDGSLRGGGALAPLLSGLSPDITVCGGNLKHPLLTEYRTVDFLEDESYLCENAWITAECALDVALPYLNRTLRRCPVLIIGWGRIGKCLGQILKGIGADVTIAVRNPSQQATLRSLGYHPEDISQLSDSLGRYRLIYNTVPFPVLSREQMGLCRADCVKIELASRDGMDDAEVIIARGLPGIHMPESSGELIAKTFLRLCLGR